MRFAFLHQKKERAPKALHKYPIQTYSIEETEEWMRKQFDLD